MTKSQEDRQNTAGNTEVGERAAEQILGHAERFRTRHRNEPGIQATYGYFTAHPIAPLNRKRLRMILDILAGQSRKLARPMRILDLASGGGIIACAAAEMGNRVLGLDLDASEIRLAQLFAEEEKQSALFWRADLLGEASWERTVDQTLGGKPDALLLAYALHHLPDVDRFVKRVAEWVEPGTLLVINEENPRSIFFRLKHQLRSVIQRDTANEWHRDYRAWRRLLEEAGFQVGEPKGADLVPGVARLFPATQCWSLVFTATKG